MAYTPPSITGISFELTTVYTPPAINNIEFVMGAESTPDELQDMSLDIEAFYQSVSDTGMDIASYYQSTESLPVDIHVIGNMFNDSILDLMLAENFLQDTLLDIKAGAWYRKDNILDLSTLGWYRKDNILDLFVALQTIDIINLSVHTAARKFINVFLDVNITSGFVTYNNAMDIHIGDGNKIQSIGLDMLLVSIKPEYKSMYTVHLNSAIREII